MTEDQLHQIDQARRYAEQDEYVVTRTHIRNLLAIIEGQAASVPDDWKPVPVEPTKMQIEAGRKLAFMNLAATTVGIYKEMLAAAPEYRPICGLKLPEQKP